MSTINRGPLGSAFLINREPAKGNGDGGSGGGSGGSSTATATIPLGEATTSGTKPGPATASLSASGAIPMPGPTLAKAPAPPESPSASASSTATLAQPGAVPVPPPKGSLVTTDLVRSLAEVKGQAQFLLYLADQIEDSLHQLIEEHDDCQNAFLCRILSMYSGQLETKHHGLGDKIAETCQEVYVTVRDYDHS